MQYASIFEAVISYLLWTRYREHDEVKILETHKAFASLSAISYDSETVFTCVRRAAKTPKNSIAF
jgi:hypothetical protein